MPLVHLAKTAAGHLAAADEAAQTYLAKLGAGEIVALNLKRVRNIQFHRKYFALLNVAFNLWEPVANDTRHGIAPEKSFEQFRKDVLILAGFYTASHRLDVSVRIDAKSISFAAMDQQEFEVVYSRSIDVLLRLVLKDMTADELRATVEQAVLEFA